MQFWVEMHLKYENELENYEPTEDGLIDTATKKKDVPDYKKDPNKEKIEKTS